MRGCNYIPDPIAWTAWKLARNCCVMPGGGGGGGGSQQRQLGNSGEGMTELYVT